MGKITVRLTLNKKNGNYEARIIGHEEGSSCGDDLDESVIEDLLNAEIDGFGDLVSADDSGKTCEYFEERKAKQSPHKYKQGHGIAEEEPSNKKDLGLGYGV